MLQKQLHTKTHCNVCASRFSGCAADVATDSYFDILTRGGLTIPSLELLQYVSQCFAVLNYTDKRDFSNVQTSLAMPPDSLFYVTTAQMFYLHVIITLHGVVK